MLFGTDRETYRKILFSAWRKFIANEAMEPLERQLAAIIQMHPEYQAFFSAEEKNSDKDFVPGLDEINPFLHIAIHQAVIDQVTIDSPAGITAIYQNLCKLFQDPHEAEHCIGHSLLMNFYDAQEAGKNFDAEKYLEELRKIIRDG